MAIDEATIVFIKDVGFPVVAFLMMLALYIRMTKSFEKKQNEDACRYENLVNRFIETIDKISTEQTKALSEMSQQLKAHVQQKDAALEMLKEMGTKR